MCENKVSKMSTLKEVKRRGRMIKNSNDNNYITDIYEKAENVKNVRKNETGIIINEIFMKHFCAWDVQHPENPERYISVLKRCKDYKLIERCKEIYSRIATLEELTMKHTVEHIELLKRTKSEKNIDKLEEFAAQYDSVYFNNNTFDGSLLAAGSCIELVKAVVEGTVQNGMALVRPPGHHAMENIYCGYCFFNNVALAAQYALNNLNVKKILIVDWDVHHGQATQQMFYDDNRVLYFSIHRYEHGEFWPNLRESNFDFIGTGAGLGYNVNFPLNETGCGDSDYAAIFHNLLLPIAYEFQPELVLVSAGYDAAIGCPEGQMKVTPACYAHLTSMLMGLASGKVVVCLEGGYFLPSLAESAALTLRALLGDPAPRVDFSELVKQTVVSTMFDVISQLRSTWKCFYNFTLTNDERDNHEVVVHYRGQPQQAPFPTRNCYPINSADRNSVYIRQIEASKLSPELLERSQAVGYCYNMDMELHENPSKSGHDFEKPERLRVAYSTLQEYHLLERMLFIESRLASEEEILLFHEERYLNKIRTMSPCTEHELNNLEGWITVYFNDKSFECAKLAVGSLLNLVDGIASGLCNSAVGLIRPPGHHAESNTASGFCICNNVVIAAKHALKIGFNRILILDWDVHHGNGTQKAFFEDNKVLYISMHRHDNGNFFPNAEDGDYTFTGQGLGQGYNVNIAWNNGVMGDAEYMFAFLKVVLPIAYEFNPEFVIISAGFDAAIADPLGGYNVTPEAYGHFTHLLKSLAGGRILIALEGGYNVRTISHCLAMCSKALLGDPLPMLSCTTQPNTAAVQAVTNVIKVHSKYWKSLLRDMNIVAPLYLQSN